ncbi:MAG: hypothetical protein IPH57_14895 [Saprospiraceae bacterium]|nr:hypothetical protein [Saprospiraceae bacterium]
MYKSIVIFFIILIFSCKNENSCTSWEISNKNAANPFFENATNVRIYNDSIVFSDIADSRSYSCYISDQKMLVSTETQKWIISMTYEIDTVLVLHEMYSKNPFNIKLHKIH